MSAKKPLLLSKDSYKNLIRVLNGNINSIIVPKINFLDEITVSHKKEFVEIQAKKSFAFSSYFISRIDRFCNLQNAANGSRLDFFIGMNLDKTMSLYIISKNYSV